MGLLRNPLSQDFPSQLTEVDLGLMAGLDVSGYDNGTEMAPHFEGDVVHWSLSKCFVFEHRLESLTPGSAFGAHSSTNESFSKISEKVGLPDACGDFRAKNPRQNCGCHGFFSPELSRREKVDRQAVLRHGIGGCRDF